MATQKFRFNPGETGVVRKSKGFTFKKDTDEIPVMVVSQITETTFCDEILNYKAVDGSGVCVLIPEEMLERM